MWAPALDWCLLAAGGIDALISFDSEIEDQLAGTIIAKEAGCGVFDFDGNPYHFGMRRIVAVNVTLQGELFELLDDKFSSLQD